MDSLCNSFFSEILVGDIFINFNPSRPKHWDGFAIQKWFINFWSFKKRSEHLMAVIIIKGQLIGKNYWVYTRRVKWLQIDLYKIAHCLHSSGYIHFEFFFVSRLHSYQLSIVPHILLRPDSWVVKLANWSCNIIAEGFRFVYPAFRFS